MRSLDGTKHDGDVGIESDRVRRSVHVKPLTRRQLVGTDDLSNLVVQNLRSSSRQSSQPGRFQRQQVRLEVHVRAPGALKYFKCAKGMYMHLGHRVVDRFHHIDVVVTIKFGMDSTLQTHLCGAGRRSLNDSLGHLFQGQQVGVTSQVEGERTLGESAKTAFEGAHVGVVDIPIDDEGDVVTGSLTTNIVGTFSYQCEIGTARTEQCRDVRLRPAWRHCPLVKEPRDGGGGLRTRQIPYRWGDVTAGCPIVLSTPHFRIRELSNGTMKVRMNPTRQIAGELGVNRQARRQIETGLMNRETQSVNGGPRPFRIHVVNGYWRYSAEVIDTECQQFTRRI